MESIIIKGTKEGLVFYFNTNLAPFEELCTKLQEKLAQSSHFFLNSFYFLAAESCLTPEQENVIHGILQENGLKLGVTPQKKAEHSFVSLDEEGGALYAYTAPKGVEPEIYSATEGNAVLLTGTLRSGQTVEIKGDAVLLGDINAGAYLMATGNIVVMGELRGLAHAGVYGDTKAYIMAWRLKAGQIRIAQVVGKGDDKAAGTGPEIARIEDGIIVISPYESTPKPKQSVL